MTPERATALLAATELFRPLPREELSRMAAAVGERHYARNEAVFLEGDQGDALYVVADGLVKVVVTSLGGSDMILATLGPPAVFGELAAVDGGPRSASVHALEPTTVLTVSRATLLDLVASRPQVADVLLRSLGAMVRRLSDQAADLVFLDLHGRVAKLLLRSAGEARLSAGDVLDVGMTQSELAAAVGASRQSVNQALQHFERDGVVDRRGRRFVVRDPAGLRRLAGR